METGDVVNRCPGNYLRRNLAEEVVDLLTEAEEECVHTHVVDAEEAVSDEVASNHHGLQGQTSVSGTGVCVSTTNHRRKNQELTMMGIQ